jgi:hypothetical protein
MGWIIEAVIDWFAIGLLELLSEKVPRWGCAALLVLPMLFWAAR